MMRIPGKDGNIYRVVSWTTFKRWRRGMALGYVFLAIAGSTGTYYYGKKANENTKDQINSYSTTSCLAASLPNSVFNKYNDLIAGIIETRSSEYNVDLAKGDMKKARVDLQAIRRYQNDFAVAPTRAQCERKVVK